MDLGLSIKQLPSKAYQALKDYFAGLRLFFNRENWSHSIVFLGTMTFFLIFALFQRQLRNLVRASAVTLAPIIVNTVTAIYLAGVGAFLGFLLLGVIILFKSGRTLMYESRFRHFLSPIIIGGFILLFAFILPPLFRSNDLFWFLLFGLPGAQGLFQLIFLVCWVVIVFLQVILLGYTIVKSIKWLSQYLSIPETGDRLKKYWIILIVLIILIPVAIWFWLPLMFSLMIILRPAPVIPSIPLPFYVRWLLEQGLIDYVIYLMLVFPLVAITAAIILWRRFPQVSIALASFGIFYPILVYYYRLRVIQYFFTWSDLVAGVTAIPFQGYGWFEMVLLLITFALALLGAAKLQRGVSPNPFGLFAIMIGTLVFMLSWVLYTDNPTFGVEYYGMITAALSAFLAVFVFIILPIAYGIYRLKKFPPTQEAKKAPIEDITAPSTTNEE